MSSFGEYIKGKRQERNLTLREAARRIGISSPYLSQIESDAERPPSVEKLKTITEIYQLPFDEVLNHAKERAEEVYGKDVVESPAIHALFKMARALGDDETKIVEAIKDICSKNNLDPQEFLDILQRHKTQFPRLPRMSEGLFAADVRPRFLSKEKIRLMAEEFLNKHGLGPTTYEPPTPIELLVEKEDGISYLIDDKLRTINNDAIELGMSHWSKRRYGVREIRINAALDTDRKVDHHRLRYTLGHELFHCLEHLMQMDKPARLADAFYKVVVIDRETKNDVCPSSRKNFTETWIESKKGPRKLITSEDWREWQSDYFSACILMPEWSLRKIFQQRFGASEIIASEGDIRRVAYTISKEIIGTNGVYSKSLNEVFEVSLIAMAIRLMELKLVR